MEQNSERSIFKGRKVFCVCILVRHLVQGFSACCMVLFNEGPRATLLRECQDKYFWHEMFSMHRLFFVGGIQFTAGKSIDGNFFVLQKNLAFVGILVTNKNIQNGSYTIIFNQVTSIREFLIKIYKCIFNLKER